ncbi:MAG: NUDIX domain-containing protein [Acutalibacteraceae bacterium]|nr:NUDIX domain-containing protein [Acutalibacteraceae bacterium]
MKEETFWANYRIEDFERYSVATDIVAFMIRSHWEDSYRHDSKKSLSILLIKRGEYPYMNSWALPGGFLRPDETVEDCANREIIEETSVIPTALMHIGVFSEINRDPRGRVISNAFVSIIGEESVKAVGGNDAIDAKWFDISFEHTSDNYNLLTLKNEEITLKAILKENSSKFGKTNFDIIDSGEIAFDHAKIIATSLTALRNEAKNFDLIFDFLPEKFTLAALQKVQETIMNISILPANFRRKVSDYVIETDEYTTGAGHRPAKLFKRK